ncbi:MAG: TRCF domain-containing protein, partial [Burkholderiales bacterium]
ARALLDVHRLRIAAKTFGIIKIDASDQAIALQFEKNPPVDPARIIALIQKHRHVKLAGQDKLRISQSHAEVKQRVQLIRSLMAELH